MGKTSKWFRALLGLKKSDPNPNTYQIPQPPKKKWSFAKSHKEKGRHKSQHGVATNDNDPSHHAVAVAAATAAVAEAAVATAQAAAVVVQLTSGTGRNTSKVPGFICMSTASCVNKAGAGRGSRKDRAVVTIQSHFRAYLSRRALRALKALVKLQALVRGHLLRKKTADVLRRMQALVRAQARARARRFLISDSPYTNLESSHFSYHGPPTPEKIEHAVRTRSMKHEQLSMLKRNGSRSSGNVSFDAEKLPTICNRSMDCRLGERSWEQGLRARNGPTDDEISDKILEVNTGKSHFTPKSKTIFHASHPSLGSDLNCQSFSTSKDSTVHQTVLSPTSGEVQSLSSLKFAQDIDETASCTADNSPQFYSASSMGGSSKRGAFTPSKSDGSRSCLNGYTDHSNPSYMSYTESSKAKARSLSAPKQRLQYDRSGSTKRYSVHGCQESRLNAHAHAHAQRVSALHANFTNKAYPGSGRLDRLGMPGEDSTGFSGGHWHRY